MSIALATRGIISGFISAGAGDREPYPVPIEKAEISIYDIKTPFVDVVVDIIPTIPIPFDGIVDYLPTIRSTIKTLPSAGRRTFPLPKNL